MKTKVKTIGILNVLPGFSIEDRPLSSKVRNEVSTTNA